MSSVRRSLGLESIVSQTFASSDEANDTVGLDLTEILEGVDSASDLQNLDNATPAELGDTDYGAAQADVETVCSIVEVLEDSGEEGASETAVKLAQEVISNILSKHGVKMRAPAFEAIAGGRATLTKETISIAKEGVGEMLKGIGRALANTAERMRVNVRQAFRYRTAWRKDAVALREMTKSSVGSPSDTAKYNKRVRIAHMTMGDQTVVASADKMHDHLLQVHNSLTGVVHFLQGLVSLYSWFNKEKGKINFDKIADNFQPSQHAKGMLSVSGKDAIFGEEMVISDFGGVSDNVDEMMAIMKRVSVQRITVWRVRDLDIGEGLAPVAIADVRRQIDTLIRLGEEVVDLYNRYDREIGPFISESYNRQNTDFDIDMIVSPIRFFRYHGQYMRLLNAMIYAVNEMFDLNMKAATCLLDYYKWSVKHNK